MVAADRKFKIVTIGKYIGRNITFRKLQPKYYAI